MRRIIITKLLRLIPIVFLVSVAAFFMLELTPGDPAAAVLGDTATPERYEEVRHELGLDKPAPERYVDWLGNAVQGDLGRSLIPPVEDVSDMIRSRLPVTLEIAMLAMIFSLVGSIPIAMWSAHRAGTSVDAVTGAAAFAAISVPSFLSALVLIFLVIFNRGSLQLAIVVAGILIGLAALWHGLRAARSGDSERPAWRLALTALGIVAAGVLLAVLLPTFPRQGFVRLTGEEGIFSNLRSAFLPALTLALIEGAVFMRVLRNDLITTLNEDFILSARAKGMTTPHILVRDALRPSSLSLVTVAGVTLGRLLGGTVIVETIFRLPGMGTLLVESIQVKDFPVVQASVLVLALLYVLVNTIVDLSYTYLDPRIRHG